MSRTIVGILGIQHARLSKKKKKRIRNPTFPYRPVVLRTTSRRRELPLPCGPRPRQNNLLPATGGAETSRRELKPDDGRTRSERRCLVTHTGQFGYVVYTCSRSSSSSSCRHTTAFFFFSGYGCRSRFAGRILFSRSSFSRSIKQFDFNKY